MSTTENAQVEDGTGAEVLDEMNELILAEVTKFSSPDEPANPEPYQNWVNTGVSPARWMVRNAENNAWIRIADFLNAPTNQIQFFSEGAAVATVAIANVFQNTQTIDRTGAAGELAVGSDLTAGVAALLRLTGLADLCETTGSNNGGMGTGSSTIRKPTQRTPASNGRR